MKYINKTKPIVATKSRPSSTNKRCRHDQEKLYKSKAQFRSDQSQPRLYQKNRHSQGENAHQKNDAFLSDRGPRQEAHQKNRHRHGPGKGAHQQNRHRHDPVGRNNLQQTVRSSGGRGPVGGNNLQQTDRPSYVSDGLKDGFQQRKPQPQEQTGGNNETIRSQNHNKVGSQNHNKVGLQNHNKVLTDPIGTVRKSRNRYSTNGRPLYNRGHLSLSDINRRLRKRRRRFEKARRQAFADEFCLMCVKRTKNNTHFSISRLFGDRKTLWTMSGGQTPAIGSKGNGRRKSRYCQRMVFKAATEKLHGLGLKYLVIHCIGQTLSKKYIFKNFYRRFRIVLLKDIPAIPHNGCRPKKVRRL